MRLGKIEALKAKEQELRMRRASVRDRSAKIGPNIRGSFKADRLCPSQIPVSKNQATGLQGFNLQNRLAAKSNQRGNRRNDFNQVLYQLSEP